MKLKDAILKLILLCLAILLDTTTYAQIQKVLISPTTQIIVSQLQKETTLHLGFGVGESGMPETDNKYYILYQELKLKSTDQELITLTNDRHKNIVLYSFLILQSRNYSGLKDIFLTHINDITEITIANGCTDVTNNVNLFMLRQLKPDDTEKIGRYLTRTEYNYYLTEISKNL